MRDLPVAITTAFLLDLLRILVDMTRLGEVARQMIFWPSCAISEAGMVAVIAFVGASHYDGRVSVSSSSSIVTVRL